MTQAESLALVRQQPMVAARRLAELSTENAALRERVSHLEALLVRSEIKPTTPSGAIPPYQKQNIRPQRARKRPGRKKGHPGAGRRTPKRIDKTEEHHLSLCPHCQGPITEQAKPRTRVIEGIPLIQSEAIEHRIFRGYCPACRKLVEPRVTAALPKSMLSLRTIVEAAWLHYLVGMSLSNLVKMFQLRGLTVTPGGFTHAFARLATLLEPAYGKILERIKGSGVLHADETGWRISGITHWLWYFGTRYWSYYVVDRHRGTKVVDRVLGSVLSGILICDFWGAYNALKAAAKQRCMFHLFTELRKVDKRKDSQPWRSFRRWLSRIIRDATVLAAVHAELDADAYAQRKARIHQRLDDLIAWPFEDKDARRLVKRLKRHRAEMLVFLDHPETVSPYNNHGEREMRKPVMTRRISHGNRSARGAETQAILMSLFRSMDLQGKEPVEAALKLAEDALAGRPLLLEEPAPAQATKAAPPLPITKTGKQTPPTHISATTETNSAFTTTESTDAEVGQINTTPVGRAPTKLALATPKHHHPSARRAGSRTSTMGPEPPLLPSPFAQPAATQ